MIRALRVVAFVEAVTFLVLLAASVNHRVFDGADLAPVLGPVHGVAFLTYLVLVLKCREGQGWSGWLTLGLLGAAVVPFGPFLVARHFEEPAPAS